MVGRRSGLRLSARAVGRAAAGWTVGLEMQLKQDRCATSAKLRKEWERRIDNNEKAVDALATASDRLGQLDRRT